MFLTRDLFIFYPNFGCYRIFFAKLWNILNKTVKKLCQKERLITKNILTLKISLPLPLLLCQIAPNDAENVGHDSQPIPHN